MTPAQTELLPCKKAIIFDGNNWHVRRIRVVEHDLEKDEKVYRCDLPISNDHATLADVPEIAALLAARSPDTLASHKAGMLEEAVNLITEARPIIRSGHLFTDDQLGEYEYRRDNFLTRAVSLPSSDPAPSERDKVTP